MTAPRTGRRRLLLRQKQLLASHVVLTFHNEPMAERLWGRNQDGLA
ncbi:MULTISPECIES: hypothetical protein [unclassified Saccharopolyspora]|nr:MULTISPECIES: hypothetical protein [unclassified Saccharopolyspora]MCA1186181.1 hypothetical protein [Saccharopolyspora sp. 6T]MCA1278384.1 hypothetical protein [Saccharopolyspora sp. 7B]